MKLFDLILKIDHYHWFVPCALLDLEWPVLHVFLNTPVAELPPDESLRVEHGVARVPRDLVLGRVTDQALVLSEGHVGGSSVVTLVVRDDLHFVVYPGAHTGVGRTQVNTDSCFS